MTLNEKARFRTYCRRKGIRGRQKKKFRRALKARRAEKGSAKDALEGMIDNG